jgi:valyl-tRNA synthetase
MMMPPPNVTGSLHMGHMLNHGSRRHRAAQTHARFQYLVVAGMDHAGIATQNVVERELRKRAHSHDLGREEFVQRVWEWKKQYGGIILKQIRRIGSSCDWSRERFTLE